jgi:hypothetical protein
MKVKSGGGNGNGNDKSTYNNDIEGGEQCENDERLGVIGIGD